jgi:hypothetical protein
VSGSPPRTRYVSAIGDFESAAAEEFYIAALKRMTPQQKWDVAIELWEMAVEASRSYLRSQHPDWPEDEIRATVARRIIEYHRSKGPIHMPGQPE